MALPFPRRVLLCVPLLAGALVSEGAAVWLLLQGRHADGLLAHLSAAALAALASASRLAARSQAAQLRAAGGAGALVVGMPVIGLLGLCFVVLPALSSSKSSALTDFRTLPMPRFEPSEDSDSALAAPPTEPLAGSPAQRVQALKALRQMAPHRALPALRRALLDPYEDVRLLAFAILEQGERSLRGRIGGVEKQLAVASLRPEEARRLHLQIAELMFELVHAGYVLGDGVGVLLERIAEHALLARGGAAEGSACLLLARAKLRLGQLAEAERALDGARRAAVSDAVWRPLLAELHFIQGRYDLVSESLSGLSELALRRPILGQLAQHWVRP